MTLGHPGCNGLWLLACLLFCLLPGPERREILETVQLASALCSPGYSLESRFQAQHHKALERTTQELARHGKKISASQLGIRGQASKPWRRPVMMRREEVAGSYSTIISPKTACSSEGWLPSSALYVDSWP